MTAEINPHFRPIDWEILGRMIGKKERKLIEAQERIVHNDLQRPLRIRGQLMFDASHGLCTTSGQSTSVTRRGVRAGQFSRSTASTCARTQRSSTANRTTPQMACWTRLDVWLTIDEDEDGEDDGV